MTYEKFVFIYCCLGLAVCFVNGYVRKLEADGLLAFAWFILWPFTPVAYIAKGIEWLYNKIKYYQPLRRLRIFYLRNF